MNFESLSRTEAVDLVMDYATAYYTGNPKVPDHVFDSLIAHIIKAWPDETIPYAVGYGYEVDGVKRPHKVPTNSLPKVKEEDFLPPQDPDLRATPKYDGISCVLYYNNGKVTEALTRGGGKGTGKPILHNLLESLINQNLHIVDDAVMALSGEVVVSLKDFEETLSDEYDLPRSAAAGIAQTQSRHPFRSYLQVQPFRIHFHDGGSLGIANKETEDRFRTVVPFVKVHPIDQPKVLKDWINHLGFPTDGAVLWDEIALKFETEKVETRVIGIRRQVSRLGKIIPVLEVEPRKLYGTTVQNVTMVNEGWVKEHEVGPGARILMTKANEIIPQYLETLETVTYEEPTSCPSCGGPVVFDGDHLLCQNNCASEAFRPKRFVWTFASLLGYANSSLTKIFEGNNISSLDDLLKQIGFLSDTGLTEHEKVFLVHVNKEFKKPLPLEKLLISLNLPGVGESWSINLAPFIDSWLLQGGPRPAFTINANVEKSLLENIDLIRKVFQKFVWAEPVQLSPDSLTVTITGKLGSITKEEFCKTYGVTQADIKKSRILICSDPSSNSGKMQAARKIGAEIMTAEEFVKKYRS